MYVTFTSEFKGRSPTSKTPHERLLNRFSFSLCLDETIVLEAKTPLACTQVKVFDGHSGPSDFACVECFVLGLLAVTAKRAFTKASQRHQLMPSSARSIIRLCFSTTEQACSSLPTLDSIASISSGMMRGPS